MIGHRLLPVSQRLSELGRLIFGVNGGLGEKSQLEGLQPGVAILLEPIGVRLRLLLREPNKRARDPEQVGIEGKPAFQEVVRLEQLGRHLLSLSDPVPCILVSGLLLRIVADPLAKLFLQLGLALHEGLVAQPTKSADPSLPAVLDVEQIFLGLAKRLGSALAIVEQERLLGVQIIEQSGERDVPQVLQACQRVEAVSASRMAGHEDKLAVFRSVFTPL